MNTRQGLIKIGQIGIGHNHGAEKMATLRKLPELFKVVGVVEADPEWRSKRATLPAYRDLPWLTEEQLLNIPGLQAVVVENDVPDLVATALRCIKAGMHIHLDKPGGESLGEFKKMLDLAEQKKLTVQMGYMFRNNPAVQFCLQAVRKGWLGQIFEVSAVMSRMDKQGYRNWLSQFHGGAMFIFGGHLIDLVISMLGQPKRVVPFQRRTYPEIDNLYDNGFAVLEYPRAVASVRTAVVEVEGFQRRQLVVCGDNGTFDLRPIETPGLGRATKNKPWETPKPKLALAKPKGSFQTGYQEVKMPPMTGRYDQQLSEFARIIRGDMENPYPMKHEFAVQQTLLAASNYPPEVVGNSIA